jgi:hypothetical protein
MLALVLMVWAYHFTLRDRPVAAVGCMALSLYMHLTLPHLLMVPLFAIAAVNGEKRRRVLVSACAAYALYMPWAAHVGLNRGSLTLLNLTQSYSVDMVIACCACLGVWALVGRLKAKDEHAIVIIAAIVSLLPISWGYAFRFWFHAAFFLALLGGAGLSHILVRWGRQTKRGVPAAFVLAMVAIALTNSVVIRYTYDHDADVPTSSQSVDALPSLYRVLLQPQSLRYWSLEKFSDNSDVRVIVAGISSLLGERDIVLVPPGAGFEASFISAMTGRATTNGMFKEVSPPDLRASEMPPVRAFLVYGAILEGPPGSRVVATTLLSLVVLDNEDIACASTVPKAALPLWLAYVLAVLACGVTVADGVFGHRRINKYIRTLVKGDS